MLLSYPSILRVFPILCFGAEGMNMNEDKIDEKDATGEWGKASSQSFSLHRFKAA